jgi:hypothetical protein
LEFLRDYNQVLVADAYGGYDGVVAGNGIARLQPPSLIVSLDWPPPASVNVLPTDFLSGRQEVRRCHKPSSNSSLNFPSSAVMSSTGFG